MVGVWEEYRAGKERMGGGMRGERMGGGMSGERMGGRNERRMGE